MSLADEAELSAIRQDPQASARISVGVMSPFWGLFAGAAVSGAAWWWMTRWARPANLEAIFGVVEGLAPNVEALAAPVVETIEEAPVVLEAVAASAIEMMDAAPAEAAVAPVIETVAQAPVIVEPVVEAVPETPAPVAEALSPDLAAKSEPKAKKAAPKLD